MLKFKGMEGGQQGKLERQKKHQEQKKQKNVCVCSWVFLSPVDPLIKDTCLRRRLEGRQGLSAKTSKNGSVFFAKLSLLHCWTTYFNQT